MWGAGTETAQKVVGGERERTAQKLYEGRGNRPSKKHWGEGEGALTAQKQFGGERQLIATSKTINKNKQRQEIWI